MKTVPLKFFGGVISLAILVIGGIALALSQRNVAKQTVGTIPNDPLVAVNNSATLPQGEIVYLVNTLTPGPPRPITYALIFRQLGNGVSSSHPLNATEITADYANLLFGCTFSPNGQYVLLKQGRPQGGFGSYRIFFWDRKTKHLEPGPVARINYQQTAWSPTSDAIAYVLGGTPEGWEEQGNKPTSLHVWNLKTGKDHLVVENPQEGIFTWTQRGTLLFPYKAEDADASKTPILRHPSVYEASTTGGTALEIIQDGYNPLPSPDDRFIAFLGWSKATKRPTRDKSDVQHQNLDLNRRGEVFGLYLFERKTGMRHLIHALKLGEAPDTVLWSQDSKSLYSIQSTYTDKQPPYIKSSDSNIYPGSGQGQIYAVDVTTLKQMAVATLLATDAMARPDPQSQFAFKGISADGAYLYVLVNELRDDGPIHGYLAISRTLYSIDLRLHSAYPVWTTEKAEGIDWRETKPALPDVPRQKSLQ